MKERPIIMGAESVLGILEDYKTHTRRVIKPREIERMEYKERVTWARNIPIFVYHCPYGQVGDRLWVREQLDLWPGSASYAADGEPVRVNREDWGKESAFLESYTRAHVPSIHMPRWASRLTLEIVSINAERLQDITNEGATAEGIVFGCDSRDHFADYWDTINAARGYPWASNPWVWVIEFKKVTQ